MVRNQLVPVGGDADSGKWRLDPSLQLSLPAGVTHESRGPPPRAHPSPGGGPAAVRRRRRWAPPARRSHRSACRCASVCVPALNTISGSPTRHRSTKTRCPYTLPNGGMAPTSNSGYSLAISSSSRQAQRGGVGEQAKLLEIDGMVSRQHGLHGLLVSDADDDLCPAASGDVRHGRLFLRRVGRGMSEAGVRDPLALQQLRRSTKAAARQLSFGQRTLASASSARLRPNGVGAKNPHFGWLMYIPRSVRRRVRQRHSAPLRHALIMLPTVASVKGVRSVHAGRVKTRPSIQHVRRDGARARKRDVLLPPDHVGHRRALRSLGDVHVPERLPRLRVDDKQPAASARFPQTECAIAPPWAACSPSASTAIVLPPKTLSLPSANACW